VPTNPSPSARVVALWLIAGAAGIGAAGAALGVGGRRPIGPRLAIGASIGAAVAILVIGVVVGLATRASRRLQRPRSRPRSRAP